MICKIRMIKKEGAVTPLCSLKTQHDSDKRVVKVQCSRELEKRC